MTTTKPVLSNAERMDKTFEAMRDRALGFYENESGSNIISLDEKGIELIASDDIYNMIGIYRRDLDAVPAVKVVLSHSRGEFDTVRVMVPDPEMFHGREEEFFPRANDTRFVKSTKPLNKLIRDLNPEMAAAAEATQQTERAERLAEKESHKRVEAKRIADKGGQMSFEGVQLSLDDIVDLTGPETQGQEQ